MEGPKMGGGCFSTGSGALVGTFTKLVGIAVGATVGEGEGGTVTISNASIFVAVGNATTPSTSLKYCPIDQ